MEDPKLGSVELDVALGGRYTIIKEQRDEQRNNGHERVGMEQNMHTKTIIEARGYTFAVCWPDCSSNPSKPPA